MAQKSRRIDRPLWTGLIDEVNAMVSSTSSGVLEFVRAEWAHLMSIPLYRDLYGAERSPPESLAELEALPTLEKKMMAGRPLADRCSAWRRDATVLVASSG